VSRLGIAASVLGVLCVSVGIVLLVWSMLSEQGITADVRDALSFDAEDAGEFAEQYGQEKRRQGEMLVGWGCASARSRTYRCLVHFDSGRRLRFYLKPTESRGFRVVEAPRSK
jgi:hypothetical protein